MNKDILKRKELSLPIMYTAGSCEKVLLEHLNAYFELLYKDHFSNVFTRETINIFIGKIRKMFEEYYLGHQYKAYKIFKEAVEYEIHDMSLVTAIMPKEAVYRARGNSGDQDYKNDEMFHIKYELRTKVQTQRFSFPGLPCLYVGASSYVCWLELNRPQFDKFQVATIKQKDASKDYKIIDLCIHPLSFYTEIVRRENGENTEHEDLTIEQYLKWWPIMACCSVAVKNEDDPFKPEYIFPQFMLQYLLEEREDLIGIKYISIKAGRISMKQYETDYRTYTNYVIPVRSAEPTEDGFCKLLKEQFYISKNISGKELEIVSDMIRENGLSWGKIGEEVKKRPLDEAKIYGTNDTEYSYEKSIFRRIEHILDTDDELEKILNKEKELPI